ncbi:hypothetical protein Q7A53_05990 [Halobacillus rhizosphaerae]|uniref:hypothetical protein n=1 Tax=Halobacillus rhizosphaerae TaxID=3064889 RepID=UPI00398B3888
MDSNLLTQVGMVINTIVYMGYGITGGYIIKTGFRYFTDYKEAVSIEKEAD